LFSPLRPVQDQEDDHQYITEVVGDEGAPDKGLLSRRQQCVLQQW